MVEVKHSKKIGVILLSLLSIGISFFFYYYVNKVDDTYSNIVEREADMFLKIQAMTNNSYKGFLAISKIANARTGIERDSLIKERMLFTGKNDLLISDLMKNIDTNIVDKQSLSQMIAARETYKKNYGFLVTHLQGNSDSIYYFFNRVLAPCFFNYQDKIAEFITINKENYLKSSSQISADVDQKSLFMLLFGFSPLIVFIVYLLLLGIVLIWLLRKGTDELMNS